MQRILSSLIGIQHSLVGNCLLCCLTFLVFAAGDSLAQREGGEDRREDRRDWRDRGDDRRRDDDNRRGRWRGRERNEDDGRSDAERMQRRLEWEAERRARYMRSLDKNGDGRVDRSEVDSERMWNSIEEKAKAAGLDTSKPLSLEKYLAARQKQESRRGQAPDPTAFGNGESPAKAPGFDTPLTPEELAMLHPDRARSVHLTVTSGDSTSSRRESSSDRNSRGSGSDRTERYARSLIERYDKNGNKILEKEEWKEMRGDPEKSDLNRDGKVTYDELVKRFNTGREEERNKSGSASRRDEKQDMNERRTYRFTSPLDRLPDDARRWVAKYDDNADGQVAMAEFSRSWTDSKVREFERYDLNGDGMVTGVEYLESR